MTVHSRSTYPFLVALFYLALAPSSSPASDFPTHRATPMRTGAADDKPGPKSPTIAWVYESTEHFIASPVASDGQLYISGLGAFNTASLHVFSTTDDHKELWSKKPPYLKQPIACPPAIVDGKVIFGD